VGSHVKPEQAMPLLELPEVQHVLWQAVSRQLRPGGPEKGSRQRQPSRSRNRELGARAWAPPPRKVSSILQAVWERGPDVRSVVEAKAQVRALRRLAAAEFQAHRKAKRRRQGPADPARDVEILRLYRDKGLTLEQVGGRYGLTRERVRQIVARLDPQAKATRTRILAEHERDRRLAEAHPCRVCGKPVLRGRRAQTCSPKCAEDWRVVRYQLDPEHHRRFRQVQARSILRNPRKHPPGQLSWARAILTGNAAPNRRFVVEGSRSAQVLERVAPELFAERTRQ
jgi:hypothetical protein